MNKILLLFFGFLASLLPALTVSADDDIQWPITDATYQITVGGQVKAEADLVDGGLYVIYQPRNNTCIEEGTDLKLMLNGLSYSALNGSTKTSYVFKLLKQDDGTWQIQSSTGGYFPVPTGNGNLYTSETAGNYSWNFNDNGYVFPRITVDGTTYGLDRASYGVYSYTTVNSTEGSAQCYQLYPVTLGEESAPEEIQEFTAYQIINANGRGMLYYSPSHSSDFVWSTGKSDSNTSAENYQWVFVKTENGDYNLYNIGRRAYIEPSNELGNYQTTATDSYSPKMTWVFTQNKVGITLEQLSNTNYALHTTDSEVYMSVSNSFVGPLISYYAPNDGGVPFYFVKGEPVSEEVKNEILNGITSLSDRDISVRQGYETVGRNNDNAVLLRVGISGNIAATINSISVKLKGDSRENIERLAVYQSNNAEFYADENPVSLGSTAPDNDEMTLTFNEGFTLKNGTNYLWLTADIKDDATLAAFVDAALTSVNYTFNETTEDIAIDASLGDPKGEAKIFATQSFAYVPTTDDCRYYRIPAMVLDKEGNIVVASDRRYSSNADLGNHKIDVSIRRSVDGGRTWSAQNLIAVGDGRNSATYGYGDPALVRTANGRIVCLMAAGKNGYFSSMRNIGICTSDDNGVTWTPVRELTTSNFTDATHNLTNQLGFWSIFTTSGKGLLKRDGTVMFTTNTLPSSGTSTSNCVIISSTDEGEHWTLGPATAYAGGDESKLEEMNDGSLLISVRQSGARGFNTGNADGTEWGTQWRNSQITANACNADILYYSRSIDNERDIMLHTYLKNTGSRQNLTLAMSIDQGQNWTDVMNIQPGGCAYSTMVRLTNGDLAILYEDESYSAGNGYAQTFLTITAEQIKEMYDALKGDTEDEDYERALAKLEDGGVYYFSTSYLNDEHVRGIYYLKADGTLTTDANQAKYFTFQKTALSGGFKAYGWKTGQFTNPTNASTNTKYIRTDWQNRDDWEAQAILLNEEGLYAVRATNAATEATWGSNAWWTTDSEGNATYDLAGGKHFIWQIVKVGTTPAFDAAETYRILDANECYMAEVESGKLTTAYLLKDDFVITPVANKKGVFTLQDKTAGKYVGAPTEVGFWTLGSTAAECHIQEVEHDGKTAYMIQAPYNNHFDNAAAVLSDAAGVENFSESTAAFVMSDNDLSHALYWTIRTTEEDIALGISQVNAENSAATAVFSPNGMRQQQLQRGLNIVRHADGKVTKVIRR